MGVVGEAVFGIGRLVGAVDTLVELFDTMVADTNAKARRRLGDYQQSIAHAANDKVLLLAEIARVLLDPDLQDDQRLAAVFAAVPKDRLAHALAECERIARPADDSHVDLLGDHYSKLRQCLPRWLEVLRFRSLRDNDELIEGIEVLRRLNRTGRRTVPEEAPPHLRPQGLAAGGPLGIRQGLPAVLGAGPALAAAGPAALRRHLGGGIPPLRPPRHLPARQGPLGRAARRLLPGAPAPGVGTGASRRARPGAGSGAGVVRVD